MKISLAGLVIEISVRYSYTASLVKDYTVEADGCDFSVSVTDEDIKAEAEASEGAFSDAYLESIALYRKIAEKLPSYDAVVFHGAVIAIGGKAYAFTARSGVGKTTHIRLWGEVFGDEVHVLNGDKPVIRIIDGTPYACGTPWRGKEGYGVPEMLPLSAIGFIERAEVPKAVKIPSKNGILRLASQIYIPNDKKNAILALGVIDRIIKGVSLFDVRANMEKESARVSYEAFMRHSSDV
ncbi:MAG: hypothetical protein IJY23_04430 [Clostridia bacterium]|nr:hypothetical protein [Clostridia bacterium]